MTFVVQNANQLRDTILELAAAHYAEFGEELDTAPESDAYRMASAFALALEVLHAHALKVEAAIFPDTALTDDLEHHAAIFGLSRKPATAARLRVRATAGIPAEQTFPLNGQTLNSRAGLRFRPVSTSGVPLESITTDEFGVVDFLVEAQTGAETTLNVGHDLQWSSNPAGIVGDAEVIAITRTGADAETSVGLATRLMRFLRCRPAAGNCAEWQEWAQRFPQVRCAFVYPATKPGVANPSHHPGAVTVVLIGNPPNVILQPSDAELVRDYILGKKTLDGDDTEGDPRKYQLCYCALDHDDITVMVPTTRTVDVSAVLTLKRERLPSWRATPLVVDPVGTTDTILKLTADPLAAGVVVGDWVAVEIPIARGGHEVRRVVERDATSITLEEPLAGPPLGGALVRAAWSGWQAATDAVLDVFDGLGPGDYSDPHDRYPSETEEWPGRLHTSSFIAALMGFFRGSATFGGVPDVIDATLTTPTSTQVPQPLEMFIPGTIVFTFT